MTRIKVLTIADYDAVCRLWTRAGMEYEGDFRESRAAMEAQMRRNRNLSFAAFDGKRLVGVVIGTTDMRRGWINRLAVDPGHRRKGVARALVERAEKAMGTRCRGKLVLAALVERGNRASLAFFRDLGYEALPVRYLRKRPRAERQSACMRC